ncbi:MAG: DUF1835 domain-containing protein [Bacteroidetes bacterium]|nr:DUF1835 domain-containing protein [Bacteroidota bacterium]
MIHIVFNTADVAVLQQAIALEPSMEGPVLEIKDEYAVGPLADMYTGEGRAARENWWRSILAGGDYEGKVDDKEVDDFKTIAALVGELRRNPEEIVWIWAAQNKHDVSGYYWLLHFLKEFQGRIYILYLNNLPFLNEKGQLFYPSWLHTIPPREYLKARKLARPITPSEFEVDPDEWQKLASENKGVRILEGGKKLVQFDYDYYDAELSKFITGDWQKASKIIHQFLSKGKQTTGDAYLLWRLKQLLADNKFDVQGDVRNMKDFELKTKSATEVATG